MCVVIICKLINNIVVHVLYYETSEQNINYNSCIFVKPQVQVQHECGVEQSGKRKSEGEPTRSTKWRRKVGI